MSSAERIIKNKNTLKNTKINEHMLINFLFYLQFLHKVYILCCINIHKTPSINNIKV